MIDSRDQEGKTADEGDRETNFPKFDGESVVGEEELTVDGLGEAMKEVRYHCQRGASMRCNYPY